MLLYIVVYSLLLIVIKVRSFEQYIRNNVYMQSYRALHTSRELWTILQYFPRLIASRSRREFIYIYALMCRSIGNVAMR